MTKTDLFKHIRRLGNLMLGYSFLKALGPIVAIVLERLLTEYNFALSKGEFYKNGFFHIDIEELNYHLGLGEENIEKALIQLSNLELISLNVYEDKYGQNIMAKIHEENIIDFEYTVERQNAYKSWSYNLRSVQENLVKDENGMYDLKSRTEE